MKASPRGGPPGRRGTALAASAAALLAAALGPGCDQGLGEHEVRPAAPGGQEVVVVPRSPYVDTFSCMEQCHAERQPDPTPRELEEFHTIRPVSHGPAIHWCTFCHDIDNPDFFRLIDGRQVAFDESYRLCGQCHGDKHRDWESGIHGQQTGSWMGLAQRRSCPFCHDPHVPGIPRVEALPRPRQPAERGRWRR